MPQTYAFLNPHINQRYDKYLTEKTLGDIVHRIESEFDYPLIVKRNRGALGRNVFKVENTRSLEKGLLDIYNLNSSAFDYICLAQEFIRIKSTQTPQRSQRFFELLLTSLHVLHNLIDIPIRGSRPHPVQIPLSRGEIVHHVAIGLQPVDMADRFSGFNKCLQMVREFFINPSVNVLGFIRIYSGSDQFDIIDNPFQACLDRLHIS